MSAQRVLVQLEGFIVFMGAVALYVHLGGNGWLFAALLFAPDLSMVGYLLNPYAGTWGYNIAHFYGVPAALLLFALLINHELGVFVALIWFAHIGIDRAIGYGLKYSTSFKDTHLNNI